MIKKLKMKNLNLLLVAVLILLMYKTPSFLTDITTNVFGRIALVITLAYILIYCEFSCAIVFSLIIIVLFHNTMEGMSVEGNANEGGEGDEGGEDNEGGEGGEGDELSDEQAEEEMKQADEQAEEEMEKAEEKAGEKAGFTGKEGFLGINMIKEKVLNKNIISNLRRSLTHNLTDLDRYFKTNAETNTMSATKQ